MSALLDGITVLDLTVWRTGPYATQLLADIGADVVKVEPPGGDPARQYPALFDLLNGGKRSIVLDLKSASDRHRFLEMAADADVVVESFRPGVVDRLGVGPDAVAEVAPSVVYCSISGYGQTGSMRDVPGHDVNYQSYAGVLRADGGKAVPPALPLADAAGGMAGAFAVCAALVRRGSSGDGERIDVSMTDVLATWTGPHGRFGMADAAAGEQLARPPAYGLFATADGWVSLGVMTEPAFWAAVCEELAMADVRVLDPVERARQGDALRQRIAAAIAPRQRDELVAALTARGVPVAPVLDRDEMLTLPFLAERGVVAPDGRMGHPVRYERHPVEPPRPSPELLR